MIQLSNRKYTPIGVDIGSRSIKLLQLSGDGSKVVNAGRWDIDEAGDDPEDESPLSETVLTAIREAHESHQFKGREAVICLTDRQLFIQSIRVPKLQGPELERAVQQEAAGRIPFPVGEAEIRFVEAADVRQSDALLREVILLACHRPELESLIEAVQASGLRPVAVDAEPLALLRCYISSLRRLEDKQARRLYVQIGHQRTIVLIADGDAPVFIKYLELGGAKLDAAIARDLNLPVDEAAKLRRHGGDRRGDSQDPEVAQIIKAAQQPVIDQLIEEVARCVRYHSVTFRGQQLSHVLIGGGEATAGVAELFSSHLAIPCDLGDPLREFDLPQRISRPTQWDIATGLALALWNLWRHNG